MTQWDGKQQRNDEETVAHIAGALSGKGTAADGAQVLASMKLLRPWPPLQTAQGPPQQQLLSDV